VQNIVFSTQFCSKLNLLGLAKDLGLTACYDPEIFPGIRISLTSPKMVVTVFSKGKAILTGAKTIEDGRRAWELISAGISPHIINDNRVLVSHETSEACRNALRSQAVAAFTKKKG
jgi:TATA-box binding protein (TBP) (component of TFIID and TFIIIB)